MNIATTTYLNQQDSQETNKQIENKKFEEETLFNKNANAVMQTINHQNGKIAELQHKCVMFSTQLGMLQAELAEIKKTQMQDLITRLGNGPTTLED